MLKSLRIFDQVYFFGTGRLGTRVRAPRSWGIRFESERTSVKDGLVDIVCSFVRLSDFDFGLGT